MKRTLDGDPAPPRQMVPTAHQMPQPLAQRMPRNGQWDSLMDPVPGMEGQSLYSVLAAFSEGFGHLRHLRDHAGVEPRSLPLAIQAIVYLDGSDGPPSASIAPQCMNVLFALGQFRLMCRLAQKCAIHYTLDIGDSVQHARTLARIGTSWPENAAVTLVLLDTLPADGSQSLRAFISRPHTLNLKLFAGGTQGRPALEYLAETLHMRRRGDLHLIAGPHALDTIGALIGIKADGITLPAQPTITASSYIDGAMLESALVALVGSSGATTLSIHPQILPDRVAARLVGARASWQTVQVPLSGELAALGNGEHQIGRLEISYAHSVFLPTRAFFHMLRQIRTHTLVVHRPMDLGEFAHVFDQYAASTPTGARLFRLEGLFVLSVGDGVDDVLALLHRDMRIEEIVPHPFVVQGDGYIGLGEDAIARLQMQNLANKAVLARAAQGNPLGKELAWTSATEAIANLLSPHESVDTLIAYVRSSQNTLIEAPSLSWMPPETRTSSPLVDKLSILPTFEFPEPLIKAAIERRLHQDGQQTIPMCQALIATRFPLRERTLADWVGLGMAYRKRWAFEDHKETGVKDHNLPNAPEASPALTTPTTSTGTTTTTTATTTTTTTTGTSNNVNAPPTGGLRATPASIKAQLAATVQPSGMRSLMRLKNDLNVYLETNPNPKSLGAKNLIATLFNQGEVAPEFDSKQPIIAILNAALMRADQMQLLRYIASLLPETVIDVRSEEVVPRLARLAASRHQGGRYMLYMPSTISDEAFEDAMTLARTVPARDLTLVVEANAYTSLGFWTKLCSFIASHQGLRLELTQGHKEPLRSMWMVDFLKNLPTDGLGGIGLAAGFTEACDAFLAALKTVALQPGVEVLRLGLNVNPRSAELLLKLKAWKEIEVVLDGKGLPFIAGEIETRLLRVKGHPPSSALLSCIHPETLELTGFLVKFDLLLTQLRKFPTIRSLKCAIGPTTPDVERMALAHLKQHPLNVELLGGANFDHFKTRISEVTMRRLLRDPETAADGAGRGWGSALAERYSQLTGAAGLVDAGAHIASLLPPEVVRVLARTNKAAYVGWQQGWRAEIEKIAASLSPAVSYPQFLNDLVKRLNAGGPLNHLQTPAHLDAPRNLTLGKAVTLRMAGVPLDVITAVIGLQLDDRATHTPQLLEVLAFFGVIQPEVWLKDAYGIDAATPPPPQPLHQPQRTLMN